MNLNHQKNFLPDFASLRVIGVLFFLTEFVAFLLTLATDNTGIGFLSEFTLRSLFSLWIAFISVVVLSGLKKWLEPLSHALAGFVVFIIIQVIGLLLSALVITVSISSPSLMSFIGTETKLLFYARTLAISALVSMAFLRYLYVTFQWQQQMEARAMAKLNALQARMRPHFLFNSLNSIASLTRINPPLAETLVEDLAELIRASMTIDDILLVPLAQEINLVGLYLAIETQRLDERLRIRWEIDEAPKDALIPPLSLQPLVENAVYYGIEPNPEGGEILISGHLHSNRLFISVRNPQSLQQTRLRPSNKIAINNLSARLNGCFDGDGVLKIESDEKTYRVTLEIPYRK